MARKELAVPYKCKLPMIMQTVQKEHKIKATVSENENTSRKWKYRGKQRTWWGCCNMVLADEGKEDYGWLWKKQWNLLEGWEFLTLTQKWLVEINGYPRKTSVFIFHGARGADIRLVLQSGLRICCLPHLLIMIPRMCTMQMSLLYYTKHFPVGKKTKRSVTYTICMQNN